MKPFNLERALAGDPVITRDGRPVKIAGYNKDATEGQEIAAWVEGFILDYNSFGKRFKKDFDLFMAPTERKEWVVVFRDPNNPIRQCIHFTDINDAKNAALTGTSTIHEITITD